jgi:NadR type nicotinamide-nucleotide adenylyltransferase
MKNEKIFKVVTVGPESTGKSTMCNLLGAHFNATVVDEYAREYLNTNGTDYTFENLLTVAQGQIALENEAIKNIKSNLLVVDTDMYVLKVWCEFVFGKCHNFILNNLSKNKADLYLLMRPDVPWVKDNLREYPDEETRWRLFYYYKDIVINSGIPFVEINSNDYNKRFETAVEAINKLIAADIKK